MSHPDTAPVVVHAFPRQAVQSVETDADGNVTKTVTEYIQE
jgi:hypothetical protein